MWGDSWLLNTILLISCTITLTSRVADESWWWALLTAAVIAVLVWQGLLGLRSSAKEAEPSRQAEGSRES